MLHLKTRRDRQLLRNLVLFGRALRRLGIDATLPQILAVVDALDHIDLTQRRDFKDAARAILVQRREQIETFDLAFDFFWSADAVKPRQRIDLGSMLRRSLHRDRSVTVLPAEDADPAAAEGGEVEVLDLRATYSAGEVLRHKDFAQLTREEARTVRRMMLERSWRIDRRRTRRKVAAADGPYLDVRRSLRGSLRHGGELVDLKWRRRRTKPRPLVVLCDISGSMEAYSRVFLQFIYALGGATDRLEAFVFGTRLTRISRQIQHRDVDQALRQAAAAVVDWGGGTRIGESFKRFNYDWGRRVLGRGAVVAILSDAWDRGDVDLLERETARLRRSCGRLMWLNPLLGTAGYEPLTRGIRRVLPYIDDFLPVHNLTSLEQLGQVLARLERGA
ncbi:MAG: VWA domain-containing protein [bacterium]|nr:VWA domain-containing protein [bacterium]